MMFEIICAICTPFTKDYKIDYIGFKRLIDKIIKDGVDGIVVGGTTGEAPTLSKKEKKHLYEFASLCVNERCKLYFGIGSFDTKDTLEFIDNIMHIDCDGYLAVVPYYNKPSQKGLFEHFKLISEKTDKEVWLYNIPKRSGVSLAFETIRKLAELPNITAIKEASDNFELMERIKKETLLRVYIGEDSLIYDAYMKKLDGVISVASHLFTKKIRQIIENGDKSDFNQYKVRFQALFNEPNPVLIKALLKKKNIINDYVRLPHVVLDEKMIDSYHKIILNDEKI